MPLVIRDRHSRQKVAKKVVFNSKIVDLGTFPNLSRMTLVIRDSHSLQNVAKGVVFNSKIVDLETFSKFAANDFGHSLQIRDKFWPKCHHSGQLFGAKWHHSGQPFGTKWLRSNCAKSRLDC